MLAELRAPVSTYKLGMDVHVHNLSAREMKTGRPQKISEHTT